MKDRVAHGVDLGEGVAQVELGRHTEISRWRNREEALATAIGRNEAVRLARRVVALDDELKTNRRA